MRLLGSVIFTLALLLLFSASQATAIVSYMNTQRLDVHSDPTLGPQTIALVDLNKDGQADIVALNVDASSVDIFRNDGNGTFPTTPVTLPVSADVVVDPVAVATGDLNHDGNVDVLMIGDGDTGISLTVWFGTRTGDFGAPTNFSFPDPGADLQPTMIGGVVADLDGDGIDDVALLGTDENGPLPVDRIYLLKSLGATKSLRAFPTFSVGTGGMGGFAIGAARFRGPTSPIDFVVSNGDSGTASVLLGKGDGTFVLQPEYLAIGDQPAGLTIADLNSDGILDVAIVDANAIADRNVSLLFGDGRGRFNDGLGHTFQHATTTADEMSTALAAADVDVNGDTDLVVTNLRQGGGSFAVLCRPSELCDDPRVMDESGFKLLPSKGTSLGEGQVAVLAGKINGDNAPDVIVLGEDGSVLGVFIDATLPNPSFGICNTNDAGQTPIGGSPVAVALADFDRDPDQSLDVAVADNSGDKIDILLSNLNPGAADVCGAFGLQAGTAITNVTAPVALVTSDLDHDGKFDIAVVGADGLSVFFGNGDGTFTAASANPMTAGTTPQSLAVGDFNHDGLSDIIVANEDSSNVSLFLASGPRTFQAPCPVSVGAKASIVVAQDLNLDGQLDFAVGSDQFNGTVSVFLQTAPTPGTQGTCPMFDALDPLTSGPPGGMVAAQFDLTDGVPDILVASNSQLLTLLGRVVSSALRYDATRTAVVPGTNASLSALAVGDFDFGDFQHDGRLDAVVADRNNNSVTVFIAGSDGSFQVPISPSSIRGVVPVGLAVGDIDGDGKLDIVVANRGNGLVTGSLTILTSGHLPTPTPSPIVPPTDTPIPVATDSPTTTPTPSVTETAVPTATSPPTVTPTRTRTPPLTATPLATDTPRGKVVLNGACAITAPGDAADRTVTLVWAAILMLVLARRHRAARLIDRS